MPYLKRRKAIRMALLPLLLVAIAVSTTSCGSYTQLPFPESTSEGQLEPGTWIRVTTSGGEQITDRLVRFTTYTIELRNRKVWMREVRSLELYEPPNLKVVTLVVGVLAYAAFVLASR